MKNARPIEKKKNVEWWRGTATHMWRTFFALERDGFDPDTISQHKKKFYVICKHVYQKYFISSDQEILRYYFTSLLNDDNHAVENYSKEHNVSTSIIWTIIRRANRTVMEEAGFLERRDGNE